MLGRSVAPSRLRPAFAPAALVCLSVSPASAMTREEFLTRVMAMSDLGSIQRLETEFSGLVAKSDEAGVRTLGERVRSENGETLDEFVAIADRLRSSAGDAEAKQIALTFGPCQYAGLLLGRIVTGAAKGELKPVFRNGSAMIDDNNLDTMFAEQMDRCEAISKKPSPARLVGSRCSVTGEGCEGDPDFADQDDDKK